MDEIVRLINEKAAEALSTESASGVPLPGTSFTWTDKDGDGVVDEGEAVFQRFDSQAGLTKEERRARRSNDGAIIFARGLRTLLPVVPPVEPPPA